MGLCVNLVHFALVNLVVLGAFTTILGGWVGGWVGGRVVRKIENKDYLSPAKAKIGAELGKNIIGECWYVK